MFPFVEQINIALHCKVQKGKVMLGQLVICSHLVTK